MSILIINQEDKSVMISQSKQKGFTIVELLIVIVVIGILAAISIVAYNNVTQKARDDQRISDARNIINAAASYQAENGSWPTTAQLGTYTTIKLSGTAAPTTTAPGRLGGTAVTSANKDSMYNYQQCGSTGVVVYYFGEADNAVKSLQAGTGTCPTNT